MPFVTVSSGGATDIPEGVYEVVLTAISDTKFVTAQRGPKAGEEIALIDWTFGILEGDHADKEITASTSTASGPKSKMFAYLTALHNGKPPAVGQGFEKADLIGRMALATVIVDDAGWPRISNLGAIPAAMLSRHVAQATGTPAQETSGAPARDRLNMKPAGDDLPF